MSDLFDGLRLDDDEPAKKPEVVVPIRPGIPVPVNMQDAARALAASDEALRQIATAAVAEVAQALDQSLIPAVEVLPPDFPLPVLTKFVPDVRIRERVLSLAAVAEATSVVGRAGVAQADAALADLRGGIKAIENHFAEPKDVANKLHKRITGLEGDWLERPKDVLASVGKQIVAEQQRLDAADREEARKAQEIADAEVRERTRQAADSAEKGGAAPEIVDRLREQAATAKAAPVSRAAAPQPKSSTITKTRKVRFASTPAEAEPNPEIKDLSDSQRLDLIQVLKAIIEGKLPIMVVKEIDWSYLNKRAAAEGIEFKVPGLEVFEDSGLRGKPGRRRS